MLFCEIKNKEPPYEAIRNMCSPDAKANGRRSPSQKYGRATSPIEKTLRTLSKVLFRLLEAKIPRGIPTAPATRVASVANVIELGKASAKRAVTGACKDIDSPRLPCRSPLIYMKNCS